MARVSLFLLAGYAIGAFSHSLIPASDPPVVKILNGTVVGNETQGIESFKGIPYATPPTGNLRLKPPQPILKSIGKLEYNDKPTACPQQSGNIDISTVPPRLLKLVKRNKFLQEIISVSNTTIAPQGEDCLTINVQRPAGAKAGSKLPVLLFIHGGAFQQGTTQQFDGSPVINRAKDLGSDIIFVAIQYRLSAFGFLPGAALQKDGSTNLGLRDQRLALEWVQENIAEFGGDPDQVVIWGESAGAWSVFNHLLINNGDNSYKDGKLFHGAIMNSGMAYPATSVSSESAEKIFQSVASAGGCLNSLDKLACLRSLSYEAFHNASDSQASQFGYNSLDLPYLARPDAGSKFYSSDPYTAIAKGHFARVPIIAGSQEDEGTLWAIMQSNVTTTRQVVDYMQTWFKTAPRKVVRGLVETYPQKAHAGAPFRTGKRYEFYAQYKRLAAIIGDFCFSLSRRVALEEMSARLPGAWSYIATYFHGLPAVGTAHGTDGLLLFNNIGSSFARNAVLTYYISFTKYLDPNTLAPKGNLRNWPRYTADRPELLNFEAQNVSLRRDGFRTASGDFLREHRFELKL